jgi:uncharacterized integral membrane protein
MADPQHVPELDGLDRLTVTLYRSGLVIAAAGLLFAGAVEVGAGLSSWSWAPRAVSVAWVLVTLGAALACANMHLYDKKFRWLIGALGWVGLVVQVMSQVVPGGLGTLVFHAGLGFVFAALSAFGLKEQFCFKVPGLRLVPLFLAVSLIPLLLGQAIPAGLLLLLSGGIFGALALAKLRMPLHFDVGRKSAYQI